MRGEPRGCQLGRDAQDENLRNGDDGLTSEHVVEIRPVGGKDFDPRAKASPKGAQEHRQTQTLVDQLSES